MRRSVVDWVHQVANNLTVRRAVTMLRYPLGVLLIVLCGFLVRPEYYFIGLGVSVFGEAIQLWCFASLAKQQDLAANGPYALVRNPMYIGRYFLIIGGVLMTGNVALLIATTVIFWFLTTKRVKREEAVLTDIFGDSYAQYCATVHRFLPSTRGVNGGHLRFFRWHLLAENHAYWNLLGAVVAWAGMYYFAFLR